MLPDQTDVDCRQAFAFEIFGERAPGARAGGSDGGQQDCVNGILFKKPCKLGRGRLEGHGVDGAQERIVKVGD